MFVHIVRREGQPPVPPPKNEAVKPKDFFNADHQVVGGMGAQISHALSMAGIPHQIKSLGIRGEFGQSAYLAEELYVKHGLTAARMAEAALTLIS